MKFCRLDPFDFSPKGFYPLGLYYLGRGIALTLLGGRQIR